MQSKTIGIIGYGRFGRLLQQLLASEHRVFFYDADSKLQHDPAFKPLAEIIKLPTLFLATPINKMEMLLRRIGSQVEATTVIDVCSVKVYPTQLMLKYLPNNINIIATHPMFGPDSYASNTQKNMMMHPARIDPAQFELWSDYFAAKNINIKIMTPEQHDKECAYSQNITHVIGRTLGELNLHSNNIETKGYASLLTLIKQTCNDSWELFHDMLQFNPYSANMLNELQQALANTINKATKNSGV